MLSEIQRANTLCRYETFDLYARTERGRFILDTTELTIEELNRGAQLAETFHESRNQYQSAKALQNNARSNYHTHQESALRGVRILRHDILYCFEDRPDIVGYFNLQPHFTKNLTGAKVPNHEREQESLAQKLINWPDLITRLRKLKGEDRTRMLDFIGGTENLIDEVDARIQAFKTTYRTWQTHQTKTSVSKCARDAAWDTFNTWFAKAAALTRRRIRSMKLPDPDTELKAFALKGRLRDPIR